MGLLGLQARLMSQALRKLTGITHGTGTTIMFIKERGRFRFQPESRGFPRIGARRGCERCDEHQDERLQRAKHQSGGYHGLRGGHGAAASHLVAIVPVALPRFSLHRISHALT
ncbi:MAG TPA: hypothetical protein VF331_19475 [Polyangiales bacterium]